MFKKTIKYTDFNGDTVTEDFFFNLTKAELLEMQLSTEGGLKEMLEKIVKAKSTPELVKMFKRIILMSYGEKTPDGKHFMKNDEIRQRFECSEPYSVLFMELATDDNAAAEFVNALLPDGFKADEEEINKIRKELSE